jgi:hypothetical protein
MQGRSAGSRGIDTACCHWLWLCLAAQNIQSLAGSKKGHRGEKKYDCCLQNSAVCIRPRAWKTVLLIYLVVHIQQRCMLEKAAHEACIQ